jgi:hypothetical protein
MSQSWQQKLGATGVATFSWQRDDEPTASTSAPSTNKSSSSTAGFHNPALAAIRASQQLQDLASKGSPGDLTNGHDTHILQQSINGLRDLAAESSRKFKTESNGSPPSDLHNALKRRISELSDQDHPNAAPPSFFYPSGTALVAGGSAGEASPPPAKRRPDPNDDTIGSDLDDSAEEEDIDSDGGDEGGDENMPLMLCLYDKVHRTKNKWRANMSHGVVCIDGREWVFEKGNGEYEW